jgi:hypothetical protein
MTLTPPLLAAMSGAKPSAKRAHELFNYDPETGKFTRTVEVGAKHEGYLMVCIDGKQYPAHRVAWLMMTGEWPSELIDHANMDRMDNRWGNLRAATTAQNQANVPRRSSNKSGWKGVSWFKPNHKWVTFIQAGGKTRNLGYFDCPAAAHFAYVVAAHAAFGEFSRGS